MMETRLKERRSGEERVDYNIELAELELRLGVQSYNNFDIYKDDDENWAHVTRVALRIMS